MRTTLNIPARPQTALGLLRDAMAETSERETLETLRDVVTLLTSDRHARLAAHAEELFVLCASRVALADGLASGSVAANHRRMREVVKEIQGGVESLPPA